MIRFRAPLRRPFGSQYHVCRRLWSWPYLMIQRKNSGSSSLGGEHSSIELPDSAVGDFDIRNAPNYDRFASFLESEIGMKDKTDIRKIAEKRPVLIRYTIPRLQETFTLFRNKLKLSSEDLQKVLRRDPQLFGKAASSLEASFVDTADQIFSGDMAAVAQIAVKNPQILNMKVEKTLMPKVTYLREQAFVGKDKALRELLVSWPKILLLSLDGRITPRVEAVKGVGLDPSMSIKKYLGLSNELFAEWFEKKTGGHLDERFISTNDAPPNLSSGQKARIVTELLTSQLPLTKIDATQILERNSGLINSSFHSLSEKLAFVVDLFDGSKEDAAQAIRKCPPLMTLSSDILAQKSIYLKQTWFSGKEAEFLPRLKTYPNLLSLSLKNRLQVRTEKAVQAGLNLADVNIGPLMQTAERNFPEYLESLLQRRLSDALPNKKNSRMI